MKLLRIKWEKIIASVLVIFFGYCIVKHMIINGFIFNILVQEIIVYGLAIAIAYYGFLVIRKLMLDK